MPQPVNESRPTGHAGQPVAGVASVALRSSTHSSWELESLGYSPSRSAAAAVTCGAANDVPIPSLNSDGPQFAYALFGPLHPGTEASTRLRGIVEKIGPPGAATSTNCLSRFE